MPALQAAWDSCKFPNATQLYPRLSDDRAVNKIVRRSLDGEAVTQVAKSRMAKADSLGPNGESSNNPEPDHRVDTTRHPLVPKTREKLLPLLRQEALLLHPTIESKLFGLLLNDDHIATFCSVPKEV